MVIRLRRFHEHDEDLRRQLAWNLQKGRKPFDATYRFLTTRDSLPTAKLGRGKGPDEIDVAGAKPFVDRVQMGNAREEMEAAEANQVHALRTATRIMKEGQEVRSPRGELQAYVLRDVSFDQVASLLEGFRYTFHNPEPTRGVGWNLKEYYRPPIDKMAVTNTGLPPRSDPLLIAA
jgi:hypothetical protein